jgi:hypothetical protein
LEFPNCLAIIIINYTPDIKRAGVSGPPARSEDGGGAAHHIPSALECVFSSGWWAELVLGVIRGNP